MTLGNRIKELREKKNISQEKLALDINTSRQTVSKWENDTVLPDSNNISVLCKYFNVSADYLLHGEEVENKKEENTNDDISANVITSGKVFNIIMLVISFILLIFGILFETIPAFKNIVSVSSGSSFLQIPVGLILIVLSLVLLLFFGVKITKNNNKNK